MPIVPAQNHQYRPLIFRFYQKRQLRAKINLIKFHRFHYQKKCLTSKLYSVQSSARDFEQLLIGEAFVHLEQVKVCCDRLRQQAVVLARVRGGVEREGRHAARARAGPQRRRARPRARRTPRALVSTQHTHANANTRARTCGTTLGPFRRME